MCHYGVRYLSVYSITRQMNGFHQYAPHKVRKEVRRCYNRKEVSSVSSKVRLIPTNEIPVRRGFARSAHFWAKCNHKFHRKWIDRSLERNSVSFQRELLASGQVSTLLKWISTVWISETARERVRNVRRDPVHSKYIERCKTASALNNIEKQKSEGKLVIKVRFLATRHRFTSYRLPPRWSDGAFPFVSPADSSWSK